MAENKDFTESQESQVSQVTKVSQIMPLKGAFYGDGFRHYFVDGVDLSGADLVTDLARDLVCASDRDYLFRCVTPSSSNSLYELILADSIDYDGSHFVCTGVDVYTFQVRVVTSVTYNSCSGSLYTSPSTSFSYNAPVRSHTVNISPSHSTFDSQTYNFSNSEFYYSSETAFQLRTKSEEVNLLACIAFILAVIGCSLWFAAIFRNVQRR